MGIGNVTMNVLLKILLFSVCLFDFIYGKMDQLFDFVYSFCARYWKNVDWNVNNLLYLKASLQKYY